MVVVLLEEESELRYVTEPEGPNARRRVQGKERRVEESEEVEAERDSVSG